MKIRRGMLLLLVFGLVAAWSVAQEKEATKGRPAGQQMPMPQPGPEMKEIAWMAGNWNVREEFEPSEMGPGGKGRGVSTVTRGPGGFSLMTQYRSSGPMGNFTGHGIIAWDPEKKVYKSYWADSMTPSVWEMDCRWEGKDMACSGEGASMGKKTVMHMKLMDVSRNSYTETGEASTDGGPFKKFMTLKYRRAR